MIKEFRASLGLLFLMMLITGIAYPAFVLGAGQALFPAQANGSLIEDNGTIIGSSLLGQSFIGSTYFHPRPSAAGDGYDAANSSGSNLAPTSADLINAVHDRVTVLREDGNMTPIPVDLVTSSASGLDPDISPAAAHFQSPHIAIARHLDVAQVDELVVRNIISPDWGFLGDSRVNVLALNRALDKLSAPNP